MVNPINGSIIARKQLNKVITELKKTDTNKKFTHVLDRWIDDNKLFCFIDKDVEDDFVIRLTSSRIESLSKVVNDDRVIRKN